MSHEKELPNLVIGWRFKNNLDLVRNPSVMFMWMPTIKKLCLNEAYTVTCIAKTLFSVKT